MLSLCLSSNLWSIRTYGWVLWSFSLDEMVPKTPKVGLRVNPMHAGGHATLLEKWCLPLSERSPLRAIQWQDWLWNSCAASRSRPRIDILPKSTVVWPPARGLEPFPSGFVSLDPRRPPSSQENIPSAWKTTETWQAEEGCQKTRDQHANKDALYLFSSLRES